MKFFFVFLLWSGSVFAQITLTTSNLPIVVINTLGQTIQDEPKIFVQMGIIDNGTGVINNISDPFNNYNGKIGIEVRGSSSQSFPKKQYAVETVDASNNKINVPLLGMPSENDWILHAPYSDKSLMRNVLIYKLANEFGEYASRTRFCELVINGSYKGVYVLMEKVKRDDNRVNITKLNPTDVSGDALTGGYLLKIDKQTGANNNGWNSTFPPFPGATQQILFQYHDPASTELVQAQKNYIQNFIFQFENTMYGIGFTDAFSGYYDLIDTKSFLDFFILNEFGKNVDGYRLSSYLYKDRDSKDKTLHLGPVWDFNLALGNADYCEGGLTTGWEVNFPCSGDGFQNPFWIKRLKQEPVFWNRFSCLWKELRTTKLHTDTLMAWIDATASELNQAQTRNFQQWQILGTYVWPNNFVGQTYAEEVNYLKSWITSRTVWIDANIEQTCSTVEWEKPENLSVFVPVGVYKTVAVSDFVKSTTNIDSVFFQTDSPNLLVFQNPDSLFFLTTATGNYNTRAVAFSNGIPKEISPLYKISTASTLLTSTNLPIFVINSGAKAIKQGEKITANLGIIDNGTINFLNGNFNGYNGKIGVEISESDTLGFPKNSYSFETQDLNGNELNVSLLGMPDENDWILQAPFSDKTLLRNVLTCKISNETGNYASKTRFCELVLNGDYKGVYVLAEKIKRDSNRINIKKINPTDTSGDALTGGYILKIDKNNGKGFASVFPPFQNATQQIFYQFYYPQADEIVTEQENYLQNYLLNFETIMDGNNYKNYFSGYYDFLNVDSFIDFFLLSELGKNVSAYRYDTFLFKNRDSKNGKLNVGPVSDFSLAFGNANLYNCQFSVDWQVDFPFQSDSLQIPFWWQKLKNDPVFLNKTASRWKKLRTDVLQTDSLKNFIDATTLFLNQSQERNFQRWQILGTLVYPNPYVFQTYQNEVNYLKTWLENRLDWVDANLPNIVSEVDWLEADSIFTPVNFGAKLPLDLIAKSQTNIDSITFVSSSPFLVVSQSSDTLFLNLSSQGNFSFKGIGWFGGIPKELSPNYVATTFVSGIEQQATVLPQKMTLSQNFPNPFNPTTTINYEFKAQNRKGNLVIFNLLGEKVKTFSLKKNGKILWNGTDENGNLVSSGIYFYRLETAEGFSESKKMIFLK
ncbi:CotH kinase family protein [bacterium]|nr:CotH kinase family protein [bacterium]